ncbi:TonB-dependent receptor [Rhodoplanes sp. TEM]|uniref:TonB-dependent receptor n=1 Tax=Rhodoplanes tepidamans TaxID=200616 RepID=A0ABT5JF42_RHOTP|nr:MULTISPECIES: TonB-dependent receptor [Rhodoplanes]MDC7788204.1 TonB-dependent receptor [Rhodoplanes tepidamans]MDC7983546.1 TonB-dependent receptor [Rhodoplanes sp. TEM]MDQ0354212.1 iron complex outermembrane receptor protein [Rhodoplanes tepidamans]
MIITTRDAAIRRADGRRPGRGLLTGSIAALLGSTILMPVVDVAVHRALAQTAETAGAVQLDELVVTSRRRDEKLWEIPFSVDVQSGEQLEEKRALDTLEALRDVPGVGVTSSGDRINNTITIRGVGPIGGALSPDDSSVITFVDGVPLPVGAANSAIFDVERVEVLKGPQNVLFGRNTMGGAISVVPVEPAFATSGYIRAEYGTDSTHRIEGAVGGTLVQDKLAARFAFRKSGAGGYVTNIAGSDLGEDQVLAGRASFLFTPTSDIRWLVSATYEKADAVPVYSMLDAPGLGMLAARNLGKDNNELAVLNSKFEYTMDWSTLTVQTSYSKLDNVQNFNNFDMLLGQQVVQGLDPMIQMLIATYGQPLTDPRYNYTNTEREISRFTQEVRLTSPENATTTWIGGLAYYRDTANIDRSMNLMNFFPSFSGLTTYDLTTTGYSGFGEVTQPLVDRLKLSLGGRLSRETKEFSSEYFADGTIANNPIFVMAGGLPIVPYFAEEDETVYKFWTGRAALSYEWNNHLTTYASAARSYKTGGYGEYFSLTYAGVAREPYDPAKGMTYEAGGRASLLDGRLLINAAAFYNDVKDEQILQLDPSGLTAYYVNIDTTSKGFEVEATWKATPYWTLAGGVGYTDARLYNVTAGLAATTPGLADGNQVPNVPPWSVKASVAYRAPASELGFGGWIGGQTVYGRVGYNYYSERFYDTGNQNELDAIHLVSARLGFDWGGGEAYVFGENLLDQQYLILTQLINLSGNSAIRGSAWSRGAVVGVGAAVRF